jgi:hypothetical protein
MDDAAFAIRQYVAASKANSFRLLSGFSLELTFTKAAGATSIASELR